MARYRLNDDDVLALQELVRDYRSRRGRDLGYATPEPLPQTPDVYAALSTSAIPALSAAGTGTGAAAGSGNVPGSGTAIIYRLADDEALEVSSASSRTVYNLFPFNIAAGVPFLTVRDKFGRWWVVAASAADELLEPGTGTGTGTGCLDPGCLILPTEPPVDPQPGNVYVTNNTLQIWNGTTWVSIALSGGDGAGSCLLAGLKPADCLEASSAGLSVLLEYDGAGAWVSTEELAYPWGSGIVRYWWEAPLPRLSVDGMELWRCGDCWVGGALTGHDPGLGTGTGDTPCSGETFEVCLECVECPGTGTGTGTSGGEVQTSCCENPIPATLPVTSHPTQNACPCVEGSNFDIVYDEIEDEWYGSTTVCDGKLLEMLVWCDGSGVNVVATCDGQSTDTANGTNPPLVWTASCGPPFKIEVGWTAFSGDSCCSSEASEHPAFVIGG